jgi:monofunctional biosynthetic peptidoglycan transglycosylase
MPSFFQRPTPQRSLRYRLGWYSAMGALWFVGGSVGITLVYRFVPPPVTITMVLDKNGFAKSWVPISKIDRRMVDAVIAGEDARFCEHHGFDGAGIASALKRNLANDGKKLRGGSTISQQTAKNAFLWQGTGWTRYMRKGLETWFTLLIETLWPKRRIMEVYLNVAETGIGTYGVEAASQRYYGHSATSLTQVEAARIAAALPSPKKRAVVGATGFTRRHGNAIAKRSGVVRRDALDDCVYE